MENAPEKAFARARPVNAPRDASRPYVLTGAERDDIATEARRAGAWLPAAIAAESRIMTPEGPRAAGTLRAGDRVLTIDRGAVPLLWVGQRMVDAPLIADRPELGPVEVPRNALAGGVPRRGLRLSPRTGFLLTARGAPPGGVLLDIRDAIGHGGIRPASLRPVAYVQLLTARHEIVVADGLPVETFHPANLTAAPEDCRQRAEIFALIPELEHDPALYGPEARPRAERLR